MTAVAACGQEVTFVVHDDAAVGLDGLDVVFDDERVVSDAGIVLVATLGRAARDRGSRPVVWSACVGIGRERRTPGAR